MNAVTKFKPRYKADTAELVLRDWDAFMSENDNVPAWQTALQTRARDKILETGIPTPKLERFKYFNLPSFLKKNNLTSAESDIAIDGNMEFVRNFNNAPNWVQKQAELSPVGVDKYGDMMLWDTANAYFNGELILDVPEDKKESDKPLNITITGHDGAAYAPRSFFHIGENSEFTIIEYHIGGGVYWNNRATQITLKKGAKLRHYRIQENSSQAAYTQNTHVTVEEGAEYHTFVLTTGAQLSRNQIHAELLGESAQCYLNGANLLNNTQHADTTITVEHHAESCISKQNYRSVVDDKATGIFQGKVHVHQAAQKTDGYQLSNALLLSPLATMNTKPELEIYADDVKCSHGTTAGCLDNNALFYLQSRGIPEDEARGLLIKAFIEEVLENIEDQSVLEQVELITNNWLANRTAKDNDDKDGWLS